MSKYTLEEKRLQSLRRQLYGKQDNQIKLSDQPKTSIQSNHGYKFEIIKQNINNTASEVDSGAIYLKKDLLKITYISFVALSLQVLLYWSLSMKLIHF